MTGLHNYPPSEDFTALVRDYRTRCLWLLSDPEHATRPEDQDRVLDAIERYGDREAFLRVRRYRSRWLSRPSGSGSAAL